MTYDPIGARIVLFGGRTGTTASSSQTWAYDGTTWTLLTPSTSPGQRGNAALAPLPARGGILLFGGWNWNTSSYLADTWLLVGDEWYSLAPSPSPSARYGNGLSTEGAGVLLFGGYASTYLGDTWRID